MIALILAACLPSACRKNTAPSALDFEITPAEPGTEDDLVVTITLSPTDSDGDSLDVVYTWYVDGTLVPDLDEDTVPAENTAKGEIWKCEAWADDGKDAGPATSHSVTVVNTLPTIEALSIEPEEPRSDEDLELSWTISDVDDDALTTETRWSIDGVPQPDLNDQAAVSADYTTRGEVWTIELSVSDGALDSVEDTADAEIGNALPAVEVTLSPDPAVTTDELSAEIATSDNDGDTLTVTYTWSVDGAEVGDGTSSLSAELFSRDQEVAVVVLPNDGTEDGDPAEASLTIDNSPPTVESGSVVIDPDPAYVADTLSCSGAWLDDDEGDTLTWAQRWLVDGTEVSSDATIDATYFAKDSVVQCGLAPDDGTDVGEEELSEELTISNTLQTIASVTLSSTSPVEGDTLTYTITGASDDDGDSLTYTAGWTVDGTWTVGGDELDSSYFERGDEIYVRVRANDGTEDGDPVKSDVATVANTAPEISSVSIDGDLYTDSEATLSITATDADGDISISYDYVWWVEGSSVGTDETLDGESWFDKDEEVYVVVTPSDDADSGSSETSDTVVVLNTPPEAPEISIEPEMPEDGESLQCIIDADSADADDDTVTYTFEWDDGVSSFTGTETTDETDDTVPEGEIEAGDEWTCTVTPDDGDDEGDYAEETVTVGGSCFVEVWSHDLSSKPSGSTTINGGWGGHSYTSVDSVSCMKQTSDWNYAYIPVTRATKDIEAIEVDIYHPTSSSTHVSWNVYWYGDHYGYNYVENGLWFNQGLSSAGMAGGNTYSSSTPITTWSSPPVPTSQWSTLRIHVDHVNLTADFYIDDVLETTETLSDSDWITGADIVLRSGGQAYTTSPNTCWANLVIYEAAEDNNCFE